MDISQATSGSDGTTTTKLEFAVFPNNVLMCRVCLAQDRKTKNMFYSPGPETDSISDRILYCTGVKFLQEDELSQEICVLCITHLTIAYEFKTTCLSADNICRKLLKEQNIMIDEQVKVNNGFVDEETKVKDEQFSEADDEFKDDEKDNYSKSDTKVKPKIKKCGYKTRVPTQKKKFKFKRLHCESCNITFKTKEESVSHRKKNHRDSEPFICEICGKSFKHRSSHYSHIRSHMAPKHECAHCDYKTWHKHDLKKHVRIHTGEKIYQCEFCSASFYTSSNLTDHTRRNHSAVKAYRFACARCGKQYYERTKFARHMDSHDEIKRHTCDVCHSCFTRRCYWKKHLLNQHGIVIPPVRPGRRKINTLKLSPDVLQEEPKIE